jgi:hypothetical protein
MDHESIYDAPTSSGKTFMIKHLDGKPLTARQAILAKCAECSGMYVDGREACEIPDCPLWPFMPYNPKKRKSRTLSDEQKKKMAVGLRKHGQLRV